MFHQGFQTPRNNKMRPRAFISFSVFGTPDETLALVFDILHQARETVFHRHIQTPRRELKIRRAAEYFGRNLRLLDSQ